MAFLCESLQVLGAASSAVDFVATHPYPVYGWDYGDYISGNYPNLQQGVIEADIAIQLYAAPADRDRIRIAVTETGVVDWNGKCVHFPLLHKRVLCIVFTRKG